MKAASLSVSSLRMFAGSRLVIKGTLPLPKQPVTPEGITSPSQTQISSLTDLQYATSPKRKLSSKVVHETVGSTSTSLRCPEKARFLGSVTIVVSGGATMRSTCDIDDPASSLVCKVPCGSRLRYLGVKELQPDDDDDEVIAVNRLLVEWQGKRGWISERSRLKDDQFAIARRDEDW